MAGRQSSEDGVREGYERSAETCEGQARRQREIEYRKPPALSRLE
ncbi:MAG: hypothetical protein ACYTFI_16820 [Planctomycetota bacterium]